MSGGQALTSGQGSVTPSESVALVGSAVTLGQGFVGAFSKDLTGSASTSAVGDVANGRLLSLRSRKVGGGAASKALIGSAATLSAGTALAVPLRPLSGIAATGAAGLFTVSRTRAVTGQATTFGAGFVGAPPPPSVAGISILFNNGEGNLPLSPRTDRSPMAYESAYTTKDGTMIEAFDGSHEQWDTLPVPLSNVIRNRVGEFIPSTNGTGNGTITEVFPWNSAGNTPYGTFGITGYDNKSYCYFDAIDSLIVLGTGSGGGQYKRDVADNGAGSRWVRNQSSSFAPVGRPPLWSSTANANALIYVPAADLPVWDEKSGYYNMPFGYNRELDVAIIPGGNKQPGPGPMDYGAASMTLMIPSQLIPGLSTNARYYLHQIGLGRATAGGVPFLLGNNRGAICCVGTYVYWGGGHDDATWPSPTPSPVRSMFRMNLASIINRTDPRISGAIATALVERLADCPVLHEESAFAADPYTNSILMFDLNGVFLYDITNNTWSNITSQLGGYVSDFSNAGFSSYIQFPHAGFIDTRSGTVLRKSYWFGGNNGNIAIANLFNKARSIKTTRAAQTWAQRSTASGVLWAHDFSESDAEVEQFTFVGGITGSNPDPTTIPNVIKRTAGIGPSGGFALRTKLIGNTLTSPTPSGVAGNSHTFNVSQASDFPDPSAVGPYDIFIGDPSDKDVQPYEAVTVTARNTGANTLTVTRRINSIDYPRPVLGVTYPYPQAASFPAGWTVGMNQGGEWRRPLVPFAAGSNGKATADAGIANGAKRSGAAYPWTTGRNQQNHYFFRRGHYGSRFYWDTSVNPSAKWASQFVASDFTANAAQGNIFEGDEFYLQWRMKVSTNMMTQHESKFFYLHNTAIGSHAQIWGQVGRNKQGEVPLASEVIPGVTYGHMVTLFTQGGDGRAVDGNGYMLSDRLSSGFGGTTKWQSDYPASGSAPTAGSYCWPGDVWVTFMLHCKFGRDNAENLPTDTSSFNIHAPYPADTNPSYQTTVEFFVHQAGWPDYKKLIGNYNFPWWFGDGISDTNYFPYHAGGLNAIWLSPFSNLYQNTGGEPPHSSTIVIDYAQAICSKKPIAPPSD